MKYKNGQIRTVGYSYAKVDLQVWKRLKDEEEVYVTRNFET
jgi:hypothetical protein